jgi:aspartyl-tRNA(Asn)/glutamyl-tRNA(Gln) amidotransferase subunit C
MPLAPQDVEKVALLARLRLDPDELVRMTEQLSRIVAYIDQLGELDTSAVAPMAHAVELYNVLAEDVPQACLPLAEVLANAPRHDQDCFLVPAVLGE